MPVALHGVTVVNLLSRAHIRISVPESRTCVMLIVVICDKIHHCAKQLTRVCLMGRVVGCATRMLRLLENNGIASVPDEGS